MIILPFHLQPQYKYELFHVQSTYCYSNIGNIYAKGLWFAKASHYRSFSDLFIVLFTMVDFLLPLIVQNVGSFDVAAIFRLLRMFRAIRALRALRVLRTIR